MEEKRSSRAAHKQMYQLACFLMWMERTFVSSYDLTSLSGCPLGKNRDLRYQKFEVHGKEGSELVITIVIMDLFRTSLCKWKVGLVDTIFKIDCNALSPFERNICLRDCSLN